MIRLDALLIICHFRIEISILSSVFGELLQCQNVASYSLLTKAYLHRIAAQHVGILCLHRLLACGHVGFPKQPAHNLRLTLSQTWARLGPDLGLTWA